MTDIIPEKELDKFIKATGFKPSGIQIENKKGDIDMPTISMFFGIIIRMYCSPGEHNPPHFQAYYQDFKAIVDINTCEITDGNLPKKQSKLVVAWSELHQEELLADWELVSKGELPFRIDPLK